MRRAWGLHGNSGGDATTVAPEPKTMPDNKLSSQAASEHGRKPGRFPTDPRARREMAPCDRLLEPPAADAPRMVDAARTKFSGSAKDRDLDPAARVHAHGLGGTRRAFRARRSRADRLERSQGEHVVEHRQVRRVAGVARGPEHAARVHDPG